MSDLSAGAERGQMARKHVFVVNGAPVFLGLMRHLLQGEDFNVTTTNYLPETFDGIAALAPDLLLIDLAVGQQAGWDLLERLHEAASTQHMPVILISTDESLLDRAKASALRYGSHCVLAKPFDIDVLVALVHDLIGRA